jgi:hypothetical protein
MAQNFMAQDAKQTMGRIGVIGRDKKRLKVRRSAWPGNNFRKILPSKMPTATND